MGWQQQQNQAAQSSSHPRNVTWTREQRLPCGFKTLGPRLGKNESLDSLGNGESLKAFEKETARIKSVLQKTRYAAALGRKDSRQEAGSQGGGNTLGKRRRELELDLGV